MKEIRFSFDDDEDIKKKSADNGLDDVGYDEYDDYDEYDNYDDYGEAYDYNEYDSQRAELRFEFEKDPETDPDENEEPDTYGEYDGDEDDGDEDDGTYDEEPDTDETKEQLRRKKAHSKAKVKRKSRRRSAKSILMTAAITAAAVIILLASPIFAVKTIEMNELSYFTTEEICSMIGLSSGDNGIFFNKGKAEKTLESNKYIASAEISFKMPDTMILTVNENKIYGYIPYLGSYLYLDREGRVIDIKAETDEKLPIIEGLKFEAFTQGEVIPVENKNAFEAALIISRAMSKYEMLDKNVKINVADEENIYAYIDNIKVLLGDTTRMEEKIKTMSEAVGEMPDGDRGTLDLRDLDKTIIFKYTT